MLQPLEHWNSIWSTLLDLQFRTVRSGPEPTSIVKQAPITLLIGSANTRTAALGLIPWGGGGGVKRVTLWPSRQRLQTRKIRTDHPRALGTSSRGGSTGLSHCRDPAPGVASHSGGAPCFITFNCYNPPNLHTRSRPPQSHQQLRKTKAGRAEDT